MAIKKTPDTDPAVPEMGAWDKFAPTENAGWAWFPFDTVNWLTSATVSSMTLAEQGLYTRALCCQWRDGYLWSDPLQLAKQIGCDNRTAKTFLARWGQDIATCLDHPVHPRGTHMLPECDLGAAWKIPTRSDRVTQTLPMGSMDVTRMSSKVGENLPMGNVGAATGQQVCDKWVSAKLHFLAIKQGKVTPPEKTDKIRRRLDREGDKRRLDQKQEISSGTPTFSIEGDDDELI